MLTVIFKNPDGHIYTDNWGAAKAKMESLVKRSRHLSADQYAARNVRKFARLAARAAEGSDEGGTARFSDN